MAKDKWIGKAVGGNPGGLHRATHTPAGEKISEKKMAKAEHSKDPKVQKEARLAETLKGLKKK